MKKKYNPKKPLIRIPTAPPTKVHRERDEEARAKLAEEEMSDLDLFEKMHDEIVPLVNTVIKDSEDVPGDIAKIQKLMDKIANNIKKGYGIALKFKVMREKPHSKNIVIRPANSATLSYINYVDEDLSIWDD